MMTHTTSVILTLMLLTGSSASFAVGMADELLPGIPTDSTSNQPQLYREKGIPKACKNPYVEKIIDAYETGKLALADLPVNPNLKTGWENWQGVCPGGKVSKPGDYCWLWMEKPKTLDEGIPMGVSVRFGPYDNTPHYHKQMECFYVLEGEALLNVRGRYVPFKKGEVVAYEGNAIHDMPVVKRGAFAHFWWYPNDSDWDSFQYHWRSTTLRNPNIQAVFDRVDRMRTDIHLAPSGSVSVESWDEKFGK